MINESQVYFDAKELDPMCSWLLAHGFSLETVRQLNNKIIEPHRFYHGPFHICYLWSLFEKRSYKMNEEERIVMGCLIAFHDVVYDVGSNKGNLKTGKNEYKSAEFFRDACLKDKPSYVTHIIGNAVYNGILMTDPANYEALTIGTYAHKFVTEFDLNHFVDPEFDLDLANWLIFKEYQLYSFQDYVEGTEAVLGRIPFSHVGEGVKRALKWLKAPGRKFSFGVYAGSFDPFHIGHASILRKAEHLFDKIIILVGSNPAKNNSTPEERARAVKELLPYHEVQPWTGLTTDYLSSLENQTGAQVTLIRGIRTDTDFASEEQNQRWMEDLKPNLKIMYVPCEANLRHVSSSGLRYLQKYQGHSVRAGALYDCKYKVDTNEHYRLTKEVFSRNINSCF